MIALDAAASELYDERQGIYRFEGEGKERTTEEMIAYYKRLTEKYPIFPSRTDCLKMTGSDGNT